MKNLNANLPIGVFDSGLGGLSVLQELETFLPNESFVYFGDNLNAPYGNKSIEELKSLSKRAVDVLKEFKVKVIVIACNTLSTNLYDYIKDCASVPVIKTLPPKSEGGDCLLCTVKTAESDFVKKNFKGKVIPLEDLAQKIEENIFDLSKIDLNPVISRLPLTTNKVILGCTHYHFIKQRLESAVSVPVVDGFLSVKNSLFSTLKKLKLFNFQNQGEITFVGESKELNYKVYSEILIKNVGSGQKS